MIERKRFKRNFASSVCRWTILTAVACCIGSSTKFVVHSWVVAPLSTSRRQRVIRTAVPGADIEQPPVEGEREAAVLSSSGPTARDNIPPRGKVNEIDFCIAPADVSLSRAYGSAFNAAADMKTAGPTLSLTRALNNASNRAVRRILLARSWPSAEALNQSLRQVAMAEKEREKQQQQQQKAANAIVATPPATSVAPSESESSKTAKCPVPRPILNVLTRSGRAKKKLDGTGLDLNGKEEDKSKDSVMVPPRPRARTDEEYVADQLAAFRERYGSLAGYSSAEDYLQAVLELATAGTESERVERIYRDGVYDESYQRVVGVLNSVGVTFVTDTATNRRKIASKLIDQDICLSALDKIRLRQEENKPNPLEEDVIVEETANAEGVKLTRDDLGGVLLSAKEPSMTRQLNVLSNIVLRALLFGGDEELLVLAETLDADRHAFTERWYPDANKESATNGDVESEEEYDMLAEVRPGVQFLNALVALLRTCYDQGVVTELNPLVPLSPSYANAYERLLASSLELGSGYVKPSISVVPSTAVTTVVQSSDRNNMIRTLPKPRNAQEELGRFAVWETSFRKANKRQDVFAYPDDLVGTWDVRDVIGGETIGRSAVVFLEGGQVKVDPPLEGLRWRLDPGPTHLDTCTFQVLNSDGTILQYRGFIDRGARLEARFSRRPIKIRGSVMFQMRDGSIDYYKDMLPINYRTGTTKFVMTKQSNDS